ncbi:hypothetical protein L2E82_45958 [Cichorium intybus]|uniref:Uncharacterized protein n=1 Tax=Cichorium intybus TaxID=13427 RepID=A0ACB8ZVD3_CICIN|nr:hypothetical protein L2E82_45958 [Cichorium intybus]
MLVYMPITSHLILNTYSKILVKENREEDNLGGNMRTVGLPDERRGVMKLKFDSLMKESDNLIVQRRGGVRQQSDHLIVNRGFAIQLDSFNALLNEFNSTPVHRQFDRFLAHRESIKPSTNHEADDILKSRSQIGVRRSKKRE